MSQSHAYRSFQIPSNAPFKLKPSPGKGWGAFATRRIARGSLILSEKPLFVIHKSHDQITEEDVRMAFEGLEPIQKHRFLCLRDNASKPFTYMSDACAENSFGIPSSNNEKHGLFILQSRFNHSCLPNSKVPITEGETIASFATRDISAGEEITFCYESDFEGRTGQERHQALRFVCDCKACLPGTPFQQLSDMRRRLVRGLQYLTLGVDVVGQEQYSNTSSSPQIIFDPKLREMAEAFEIPLSARLIYNLLVMALLEEEELMDDFLVKTSVLKIAGFFQTESNAETARVAIEQRTWLQKFCTALRLDGRSDAADQGFAMLLRRVQRLSPN